MDDHIAVITGASSGIGRITALRLAQSGTHVVLGARSMQALRTVAEECQAYGVEAIALETDVTREEEVKRLAAAAIDRFGSFTIWINNAGVTALGAFEEVPADVFKQVMDTNYLGCVYGSQAALKQFKIQQYGTLINVSSVFGAIPSPYESPYIASKFAVRGLTGSIREELLLDNYTDIHVCTVMPSTIDTPIYRNSANYSKRSVQPVPPVYPAAQVASAILELIENPQPEIIVGNAGRLLAGAHALLPVGVFERSFANYIDATHFAEDPSAVSDGNLATASKTTGISGNWSISETPTRTVALIAAGVTTGIAAVWLMHKWLSRSKS